MTSSSTVDQPVSAEQTTTADSLATGLLFMLSLTVGQRLIGFVRSILFCGVLRDDELGRWSLAYSFLMLAAPLAVVGIPGSFGRYVEYYRSRGQLGLFLRRTVFVSAALVAVTLAMLRVWGPTWAWLVLGDAALAPLMGLLTITLLVVIAFNFATELLTAMRQVRTVSMMRFVSSVLFAVLAIGLLALTSLREEGVIIAFGLSFLIATLLAIGPLRQVQAEAIASSNALPRRDLWGKLLPFATWVWLINLLANLFDAADRFMIVHFAKETAISADSLVGQYHSSRVVPCLLVAVAGIVGGVLLPYMSHDWEAGDHGAVRRRQALSLKICGLLLTAGGAMILIASPILFTWILRGKYDQGLAVLPWTLTYCVWFSLITVAQNYLWCAEKARMGTLALLIGLGANIGLNFLLLPRFGLIGAVLATAMGNAIALALILCFTRWQGMAIDRGVLVCCGLPVILALGPASATAALLALWFYTLRHDWLFDEDEKREMSDVVTRYVNRLRSTNKKTALQSM